MHCVAYMLEPITHRLWETPMDCTHQAALSVEFPRQESWVGLPFSTPGKLPHPGIESALSSCQCRLPLEPPRKPHVCMCVCVCIHIYMCVYIYMYINIKFWNPKASVYKTQKAFRACLAGYSAWRRLFISSWNVSLGSEVGIKPSILEMALKPWSWACPQQGRGVGSSDPSMVSPSPFPDP